LKAHFVRKAKDELFAITSLILRIKLEVVSDILEPSLKSLQFFYHPN
jgi:hypothetical protein